MHSPHLRGGGFLVVATTNADIITITKLSPLVQRVIYELGYTYYSAAFFLDSE